MLDPVISLIASLCGALLFGWAAVHKWSAFREFSATVAEYRLMPALVAPIVAVAIALIETAVCAALLWPQARPGGAVAGAALLLVYACAMSINLARGRRHLDCGCGFVRQSISAGMVVRNLTLSALLVLPSLPPSARPMTFGDYATVAGALVVGVLLYSSAELLLARPARRDAPAMEAS